MLVGRIGDPSPDQELKTVVASGVSSDATFKLTTGTEREIASRKTQDLESGLMPKQDPSDIEPERWDEDDQLHSPEKPVERRGYCAALNRVLVIWFSILFSRIAVLFGARPRRDK